MKRIAHSLLLSLFLLGILDLSAQNPADSMALNNSRNWRTIWQTNGLTCRIFDSRKRDPTTHLFETMQTIFVVELAPADYRFAITQPERRTRTSRMACGAENATVAVNGGFFVTGTDRAIPNDFLKIDGETVSPETAKGWGNGAVAFNSTGDLTKLRFIPWNNASEQSDKTRSYENVMAAGPLLISGNRILAGWENPDKRNLTAEQKQSIFAPRTAIGAKADGTIVLLVVDGRRKRSFGMSLAELAQMGRWLGIEDLLNLDGGGSSTLWLKGRGVVNRPSDGIGIFHIERKVANSIQALPRRK